MNTERTIILENVSDQPIGLKDTQARVYRLQVGAKVRISQVSLQDILDYPASKIMFKEGLVKFRNIDSETLFNMGLTEEEIVSFSLDDMSAIVITEDLEDETAEEEVIPVEEPKKEVVAKPAAKKATTAKKTTTTKKTSSAKK